MLRKFGVCDVWGRLDFPLEARNDSEVSSDVHFYFIL